MKERHANFAGGQLGMFAILLLLSPAQLAVAQKSASVVQKSPARQQTETFFAKHCVACHSAKDPKAGFRIDTILFDFSKRHARQQWERIVERLQNGEMPPKQQARPDPEQLKSVSQWATKQLEESNPLRGKVVLRRLNRRQYVNTIRDLTGLQHVPRVEFPADASAFGFDSGGLSLSPVHLEKYLQSARKIIDAAVPIGPIPKVLKWQFDLEHAAGKPHFWLLRPNRNGKQVMFARLSTGTNQKRDEFLVVRDQAWNKKVRIREFKVLRPGTYRILVRAAGKVPKRADVATAGLKLHEAKIQNAIAVENRANVKKKLKEHWDQDLKPRVQSHFQSDPIYTYGPARLRVVLNQSESLGAMDVVNSIDQPEVYEFVANLDSQQCELEIQNSYHVPSTADNFFMLGDPKFPRPELYIDWVRVEGPIHEPAATDGETTILGIPTSNGNDIDDAEPDVRKVLEDFMRRAFRRPVEASELDQMVALFQKSRKNHDSFNAAIKLPLIAILSSPHFLFLVESNSAEAPNAKLNAYELASRLSYFLWQTMPDEALFNLANSGELLERAVLDRQIDRLLADPKSQAFVTSFSNQWLGLQEAAAVAPDKRLYPHFDEHLFDSMMLESERFFDEILKSSLPIDHFLKSDFTMLNERLARFYGISDVKGDSFRRVPLKSPSQRGGILTQASMHLVTSNGTRTSPVKRGVWVLESILGSPPPPAPPNVGDIETRVPGINKATVRARLEAHRANQACASCHAKIDPFGFALENYNAIGKWRQRAVLGVDGRIQDADPKIDNLAQLPNGTEVRGVHQLQDELLKRRHVFLRCLVKKLMTFAIGREITFSDRHAIARIVNNAPNHQHTLAGLIKDIIRSDAFLTK